MGRGRGRHGSRRLTLARNSPTSLSRDVDHLNSDQAEYENDTKQKSAVKVNQYQETNGNELSKGSGNMDRANQANKKSNVTKPTATARKENQSHDGFHNDD